MNPIALELNNAIAAAAPHVLEMLSTLGREMYMPKGILTQAAEAKQHAHRYDATIGTAMEHGQAMNLPSVMSSLKGISPNDALLYAPAPGLMALRQEWQRKTLADNPDLQGKPMSLPVVTNGLTHGLSLVADLFVEPGDVVLVPDMMWENYHLIFAVGRQAQFRQFPFFKGNGLNLDGFRKALGEVCAERGKVVVLMNFPNNPTGYAPSEAEARELSAALRAAAEGGANVVALIDDAYFGLFFEAQVMKRSIFGQLAGAHPRLLAIKADAATKEAYVWGLRVGFLTFSSGAAAASDCPLYQALEKKVAGCIRAAVSNCSQLSQKVVLDALRNPDFMAQRSAKAAVLQARAAKVKEVLAEERFAEAWTPYPFNSGYFMCLRLKRVNAEALRLHLLKAYGIGVIANNDTDIRIAFSCIELDQIPDLFELLLKACRDLAGA